MGDDVRQSGGTASRSAAAGPSGAAEFLPATQAAHPIWVWPGHPPGSLTDAMGLTGQQPEGSAVAPPGPARRHAPRTAGLVPRTSGPLALNTHFTVDVVALYRLCTYASRENRGRRVTRTAGPVVTWNRARL